MIDFEEAKNLVKKLYEEQGLKLVDEHQKELYFKLTLTSQGSPIRVSEEEILDYSQHAEIIKQAKVSPMETSIIGPGFREQLVDFSSDRGPILFLRDRVIKFSDPNNENVRVEIGAPSATFFYASLARKEWSAFLRDRLLRGYLRQASMQDIISRHLTIKYFDPTLTLEDASHNKISAILESVLFEVSYLKNTHLELRNEWPESRRMIRERPFRRISTSGLEFQLKKVQYIEPVVRFYRRGVAASDPYIQFLSLYHVLEYFFVTVNDNILYQRMSRVLNDPAFRTKPTHLDRLILAVEDHRRATDETEMLKNVLTEYLEEADIIEFIRIYESHGNQKFYTEKGSCFGQSLDKITLNEGHVFGPIAKRIKIIRNTLVHSSDRYERKERYVPGQAADKALLKEIPLLRHMAERVIIATAAADD